MRTAILALLAALQLSAARQPGFSIHEDILAYPQFEVVFSESYILEEDAQLLLEGAGRHDPSAYQNNPAAAAPTTSHTNNIAPKAATGQNGAHSNDDDDSEAADGTQISETFEIMNMPPSRYLCSVPVLAPPPPPNQTAAELARAGEARELARMSGRGVDIISTLEGECLYYMSGWWSYSFCYGKEIVQFHALTTKTGKPVKDPHSQDYVLGRMKKRQNENTAQGEAEAHAIHAKDVEVQKPLGGSASTKPGGDAYNTELQVKGDQRYMVQRLGGGTVCDLTGRERTVEIQYHCNPGGTNDRISWIKEVTTCSYLMEVRTPRLCEEPAFLPPKPTRAHPISCRLIVRSEEEAVQWHQQKTIEAYAAMRGVPTAAGAEAEDRDATARAGDGQDGQTPHNQAGIVVGGVTIGARKALGRGQDGQPPLKLEAPKHFGGGNDAKLLANNGRVVKVLVRAASKANGGEVAIVSTEELKELNIRHDVIKELVGKLVKIADGRAWRLEAVENPGDPALEIRAVLEPEEGDDAEWGVSNDATEKSEKTDETKNKVGDKNDKNDAKETKQPTDKVTVTVEKVEGETDAPNAGDDIDDEGSEETFKKDEL
ncbi:protein OS-9 [Sporothrix schenckii 1099-18]|uniref:Endoplasmic reticulum lectin n=1 Tax=Sporothrix schenckii 1099-18 TaxID=1397361 RepID=A0A0F2LZ67_SPOSC|nr:protein OS-9 [Sporothrix schenckii 1099-18]KJR82124.1 protein OS-9 [Sporothrix schenckii 1099-18]